MKKYSKYKPIAKSRTRAMLCSLGNTKELYHDGIENIDVNLPKETQNQLIEEQKYIDSIIENIKYYCMHVRHPIKVFTDNIFEDSDEKIDKTIFEGDNILTIHPDILNMLPWYEIPEFIKRLTSSAFLSFGHITVDGFLMLMNCLKKHGMDNIISEIIELISYDTIDMRNHRYRRKSKRPARKIKNIDELCKLREYFPISTADAVYYNLLDVDFLNKTIKEEPSKLKWLSLYSEYTSESNNICDEFFFESILREYSMYSDFNMKVGSSVYTSYLMDDPQLGRTYTRESIYVVEMLDTLHNMETNMDLNKRMGCLENWLKGMLTLDNLNIRAIMSSITFLSMKKVFRRFLSDLPKEYFGLDVRVRECYNSTLKVLIGKAIELLGGEDNECAYKRFNLLLINRMIAYDIIFKEFETTLKFYSGYNSRCYSSIAFRLAYTDHFKKKCSNNISYYEFIDNVAVDFFNDDDDEESSKNLGEEYISELMEYISELLYNFMLTLCNDWDMSYISKNNTSSLENTLIYMDYLLQLPIMEEIENYYNDLVAKSEEKTDSDQVILLPYQRPVIDGISFLIGIDNSPYQFMNCYLNLDNLRLNSPYHTNPNSVYVILYHSIHKLKIKVKALKNLSSMDLLEDLTDEFYKLDLLLTSLLCKFGTTKGNLGLLMGNLQTYIGYNIIPAMVEIHTILGDLNALKDSYKNNNYKLYLNMLYLKALEQVAKKSYHFTLSKVSYKDTSSGAVLKVNPKRFSFISQGDLAIHKELDGNTNDVEILDEFLRIMKELLSGVNNKYMTFKKVNYDYNYSSAVYVVPDSSMIQKELDENEIPDESIIGLPFDKYFGSGLFKEDHVNSTNVSQLISLWKSKFIKEMYYSCLNLSLVPKHRTIFNFTYYDYIHLRYPENATLDKEKVYATFETIETYVHIDTKDMIDLDTSQHLVTMSLTESNSAKAKMSNFQITNIFNFLYDIIAEVDSNTCTFTTSYNTQNLFDESLHSLTKLSNLIYLDILSLRKGDGKNSTNSFLDVNRFLTDYPNKDNLVIYFPRNSATILFDKFIIHYESILVYVYSYIQILRAVLMYISKPELETNEEFIASTIDDDLVSSIADDVSVFLTTLFEGEIEVYTKDIKDLYNDALSLYKVLLGRFKNVTLSIKDGYEDMNDLSDYDKRGMESINSSITKFNDVKGYYTSKLESLNEI